MLGKIIVFSLILIIEPRVVVGAASSIEPHPNGDNSTTLRRIQRDTVHCGPTATGLFPHPYDCTKFLNCDQGLTYIQDCGAGTMFNPAHNGCDYPQNVNCPTKSIANVATQTSRYTPQIVTNGLPPPSVFEWDGDKEPISDFISPHCPPLTGSARCSTYTCMHCHVERLPCSRGKICCFDGCDYNCIRDPRLRRRNNRQHR